MSHSRNHKRFAVFLLALVAITILSMAAARQAVFIYGLAKVEKIAPADAWPDDEQRIVQLTRWTFLQFQSNEHDSAPPLYRIIPYISNYRLPRLIRMPRGAIEFLIGDGICDSAARTLTFMLLTLDIETKQTNIVTKRGGHVGTSAFLKNGTEIFVDPDQGLVAHKGGRLISIHELSSALLAGGDPVALLAPVSEKSKPVDFYREWDKRTAVGYQAEGMTIDFVLPKITAPVRLGAPDGSSQDVASEGNNIGISSYFSYIGSRYDRSWVRILRVRNPVQVKFVMTGEVDAGLLQGAEPRPVIQGNSVIWHLSKNVPLVLSGRDVPLRFQSSENYQKADFIEIAPLASSASGEDAARDGRAGSNAAPLAGMIWPRTAALSLSP